MRKTSLTGEKGNHYRFRHSPVAAVASGIFLAVCISLFFVQPVCAAVPVSSFTANQTINSIYPMAVQFTDTSTGSPTAWNWSFGDTYTSTSKNPVHVYTVAPAVDYDVLFNASNSDGVGDDALGHIHLTSDVDSNVVSWLHFNSSAIRGELGNAWTASGGAIFVTSPYKFNGGSLRIPSSSAYISSGSSPAWNIGSGSAEIEFWIYVTGLTSANNIVARTSGTGSGTTSGWGFRNNNAGDSGYGFWMGRTSNITPLFTIPKSSWHHIVVAIPASGKINVYEDGVIVATMTRPPGSYDTANPIVIGSRGGTITYNMDEFRMSTGTPRFMMNPFSPPYDTYRGNFTSTYKNINENMSLFYKSWPDNGGPIANESPVNRTLATMNVTNAVAINVSVIFDPIFETAGTPFPNTTGLAKYPDLQVTEVDIDNDNGLVDFTISRSGEGPISSLFDNRTSLVEIPFVYYNYTPEDYWYTYFTYGYQTEGVHHMIYPIYNFLQNKRPIATWIIKPYFTANKTSAQTGDAILFTDASKGEPAGWTTWNWSFGDGSWTNGTTQNPTHAYSAAGTYTINMTSSLLANASVTNTTTRTNYITVSPAPSFSISTNNPSVTLNLDPSHSPATDSTDTLLVTATNGFTITVADSTARTNSSHIGYMGSYTGSTYDGTGPVCASPLGIAGTTVGTTTGYTLTGPIKSLADGGSLLYSGSAAVSSQTFANIFTQPVSYYDRRLSSGSNYKIDLTYTITPN